MSQEITLDGATYISSKRAAEITGYTQDYVGQLARGGKIDARRVSGLWYIKQDSLLEHKEKADAYVPIPPQTKSQASPVAEDSFVADDGNTYVSASRASELTRYHQDYIGQLAREEKIPSRQVGNRWYVDLETLKAHKKEKDALLGAVQAESVGIQRVQEREFRDEPQSAHKETSLHFTYVREALSSPDRFSPKDAFEKEDDAEEEESAMRDTTIPIRVVREMRVQKTGTQEASVRRKYHQSGLANKLLVISGVFLSLIVVSVLGLAFFSTGLGTIVGSRNENTITEGSGTSKTSSGLRSIFTRDLHYERAH